MGMYKPSGRKRTRSLHDTLNEAEHDHFLDCPNADVKLRAAALLLDVILCFLILSGIHHVWETARLVTPNLLGPGASVTKLTYWNATLFYCASSLKLFVVYTYFIWTVVILGATPAKLLLGVRVLDARTGRKLNVPRTLIRESLKIGVLAGGFLFSLKRKKFLHDQVARSVVKRVHGGP